MKFQTVVMIEAATVALFFVLWLFSIAGKRARKERQSYASIRRALKANDKGFLE